MKNVKILFPLAFLILGSLFTSCMKDETAPPVKELVHIFSDKTTSTQVDSFIQAKNQTWLKNLSDKHKKNGTVFIVSYLFANTANVTNKHFVEYAPPVLRGDIHEPTAKKMAKRKYENRKKEYDLRFDERLANKVFSSKKLPSGSNIVGSLKQISDVIQDYPDYKISLYLFSDAQECSDFRKMYCGGATPPSSYNEVKEWAKKDFERLKEKYHLQDSVLQQVSDLHIILPAHEMEQSDAYELVPLYWKELLKSFGLKNNVKFH